MTAGQAVSHALARSNARRQPARSHDDKASMQAAAGVVSRWIAALVTDKRASLD